MPLRATPHRSWDRRGDPGLVAPTPFGACCDDGFLPFGDGEYWACGEHGEWVGFGAVELSVLWKLEKERKKEDII